MRKPFIAGNWKMYKTVAEGVALAEGLKQTLADVTTMELAVCTPATALMAVGQTLAGSHIGVGAQNMFWKDEGAFTGEISPLMVKEWAQYVILGHSERRQFFGETDETVNLKLKAALAHGLTPIVCIGESLDQNKAGETVDFVGSQMRGAFTGVSAGDAVKVVLAYEPIWAIGTGLTATPEDANRIIKAAIRDVLTALYDAETAGAIRVQYGGSVKPDNMADFIVMPEIDGALVGGASLKVDSFTAIVKNAIAALSV
ncbi:MAG TPA: triose-phosphate isomerase [Anaerolineae bacterium]|nr:triose-phosphate isomerase [Anaerolineae bacterium]HQH38940.1 triose-phosphate isomerase [Anaerolineae bacterium]